MVSDHISSGIALLAVQGVSSVRTIRCYNEASQARTDWSKPPPEGRWAISPLIARFLVDDQGQDIAEYAVMLAVILVLVVGTIGLVGSNANNAFSAAASSIQHRLCTAPEMKRA